MSPELNNYEDKSYLNFDTFIKFVLFKHFFDFFKKYCIKILFILIPGF